MHQKFGMLPDSEGFSMGPIVGQYKHPWCPWMPREGVWLPRRVMDFREELELFWGFDVSEKFAAFFWMFRDVSSNWGLGNLRVPLESPFEAR
jgi:hypothetical protein